MARSRRFRRALVITVCAVAVAGTVGFGGYKAYQGQQSADRCAQTSAALDKRGPFLSVSKGSPKLYVLGDSYTAAEHLDNPSDGWVNRIAPAGWAVEADGIGGTGFMAGAWCGDDQFGSVSRIATIRAEHPDTLIIQGGINDADADPTTVEAAAYNLLGEVAAVRRVIVVGPADAPSRSDGAHKIDAALRKATEAKGREYVSAIDWPLEFLPDRLHMTPAGHSLFAARVAETLTAR